MGHSNFFGPDHWSAFRWRQPQALALLVAHRRQGLGDAALVGGTLN